MNPPIDTWVQLTGWALIHSVWQAAAVALALAATLRVFRTRSAEIRYALACTGLLLAIAAPVLTVAVANPSAVPTSEIPAAREALPLSGGPASPQIAALEDGARPEPNVTGSRQLLDDWLPTVVWTWLACVAVLLVRYAGGFWHVRRLRLHSSNVAPSTWQATAERVAARLRIKAAFRVVESAAVDSPSVIGAIRPMILLPVAALTTLTPAQVEALLAHELAHIRRGDYLVNLLQTVVETLLFFHPAVWWMSSRIRAEREHCCDDVAVAVCGEAESYAAALAELAAVRSEGAALAMGAVRGPILARIKRLLDLPDDEPRSAGGVAALALGLALIAAYAVHATAAGTLVPAAQQPQSRQGWVTRSTDHFDVQFPPELDIHAERVAVDAERAYEHVSDDLRHNLAFRIPVLLFRTTAELERAAPGPGSSQPPVDSPHDRILFAVDRPADQWPALLRHEVAHVFSFDILPASTPQWILEGLADYQRPAWDPDDLVTVRAAVRSDAIPALSSWDRTAGNVNPRVVSAFGHAAFDFIESRWGKAGMRQFLFAVRQSAQGGSDPFQRSLQIARDEFDRAFAQYLRDRFSATAQAAPVRFDFNLSTRLEGQVTALRSDAREGQSCLELWVPGANGARKRWGIECRGVAVQTLSSVKPGDSVEVTGAPARDPATQRMVAYQIKITTAAKE